MKKFLLIEKITYFFYITPNFCYSFYENVFIDKISEEYNLLESHQESTIEELLLELGIKK